MYVINEGYFIGEIYIPHAQPGVTDNAVQIQGQLKGFIGQYSYECLVKILGRRLAEAFILQLDSSRATGLKDLADAKWGYLLNGHSYEYEGKTHYWRGLRAKMSPSDSNYTLSPLAYYTYFFYESNDWITRSDIGHQVEVAKNAERVVPSHKVAKAWNKFVGWVQGESELEQRLIVREFGLGIDWFGSGEADVTLYQFIKEQNLLVEDTYPDFNPTTLKYINDLGI